MVEKSAFGAGLGYFEVRLLNKVTNTYEVARVELNLDYMVKNVIWKVY